MIAREIRADCARAYMRTVRPSHVRLDGIRLRLDDRWATPDVRRAIYGGRYEEPERRILARTLRPDDRYLEVGGGIGFVATTACRRVGAENVIVYEANPELAAVAVDTAQRNGFDLAVVCAVVAERAGEVDFYVHQDFWASSLAPSDAATKIRVPARSFFGEVGHIQATYLMVDAEGAEIALLGSSERVPDCVRAVCVETHTAVTGVDAIQAMLVKLIGDGFTLDLGESGSSVVFLSRRE